MGQAYYYNKKDAGGGVMEPIRGFQVDMAALKREEVNEDGR